MSTSISVCACLSGYLPCVLNLRVLSISVCLSQEILEGVEGQKEVELIYACVSLSECLVFLASPPFLFIQYLLLQSSESEKSYVSWISSPFPRSFGPYVSIAIAYTSMLVHLRIGFLSDFILALLDN